jgi:integrase
MGTSSVPAGLKPPTLLSVTRAVLRRRHYSSRTEKCYLFWIRRFVRFHARRHPRDMGQAEVTAFLSYLALGRQVASSTQNQALQALLFLYRVVLEVPLPWLDGLDRAKRPVRRPTVLTRDEVKRVLGQLDGVPSVVAGLLYGAGLRLRECLGLRVKDVDLARREITIRQGKGGKDRITMLPERCSSINS